MQKDGNHATEGAPFPNKTAKLQKFHQLTQIGLRGKSMGKLKRQQEQASEMPNDAKHHASVLARKDAQLGDSDVYEI